MNKNKFDVDDVVMILGHTGHEYKVISVVFKNTYVYGIYYTGYMYRVIEQKTKDILDVFESEMRLVHKNDNKQVVIKHVNKGVEQVIKDVEDDLFERQIKWMEYEGYLALFNDTGDMKYQDAAVNIYCELVHSRDNK